MVTIKLVNHSVNDWVQPINAYVQPF